MEDYSISKERIKRLQRLYNLKVQIFSGSWCHNCTNNLYKIVKRDGKYYPECIHCGVLDNKF